MNDMKLLFLVKLNVVNVTMLRAYGLILTYQARGLQNAKR